MKTLNEELLKISGTLDLNKIIRKSYYEALQDLNFKEVISQINLNDDILMKYTSSLEEVVLERNNCLNCNSLMECKNKIPGHAFKPIVVDGNLDFGYLACYYQKELNNKTKHLKNVSLFKLPNELKYASMKDIYHDDANRFEVITWVTKFIKNYPNNKKGLYLSGSFGSGKTYLLAAMFNELAKDGVKSIILYWPEFLRELKASFQTDFKEKFDSVQKVPLLLIDDIGAESSTEWSRDEILGPILQYRMQMKLPTFFTSNLDIELLEKHLSTTKDKISVLKSKRIIERIMELTVPIEMIGKNLRNKS